jgi:membrane protease YdiL (CAAX protease family)
MTALKRYPAAAYFVLAFAISWGGLLMVGRPAGTTGTAWQSDPKLPWLFVAMLAGPFSAGVLMTLVTAGRAGLRQLGSSLLRWRADALSYMVAIGLAPLVFAAVQLVVGRILTGVTPAIVGSPDPAAFLLGGIAAALVVGLFEEIGWTGFALPRLRPRHTLPATGLLIGVPWGAWHLLTNDLWIAGTHAGELSAALFVIVNGIGLLAGQLPAYRVLMVWVHDRTGSLLLAVLMHASLAACTFTLGPSVAGLPFLIYGFAMTAAWWVVAAGVVAAERVLVHRQPVRGRQPA